MGIQGFSGSIRVSTSEYPKTLYRHQQDAIDAMEEQMHNRPHYKSLLVIPTGGGKTFTAVYWMLKNVINEGKKVLWIAHRHELLNQALDTVCQTAYREVLPHRDTFSFRVLSGIHDRPVNMRKEDDLIIASKESLTSGQAYLEAWVRENKDQICLIIDEAHHTAARSYRSIIDLVESYSTKWFWMLGLTATPMRTVERENQSLSALFPQGIVYGVNLKTLIERGILAKPILRDIHTKVTIKDALTPQELRIIQSIGKLPEEMGRRIAHHAERNRLIVNHYMQNQAVYGKCIVFAMGVDHAIVLNALFQARGVRSDYVVSDIRDMYSGVGVSKEENGIKIKKFREGALDVLINVNILTEGADVPDIQTVFLTRPTTSTILMNQMIGRGLRGVKAGGTEEAYIVSFVDDWRYHINWINPEMVLPGEIIETTASNRRPLQTTLIPIKVIEVCARWLDSQVEEKYLHMSYSERIPKGSYVFDLEDKHCEVLVFEHLQAAYEQMCCNVSFICKEMEGNEETIDELVCRQVKETYFEGYDLEFGFEEESIQDILLYYIQTGDVPTWIDFDERNDYDITPLAQAIVEQQMPIPTQLAYLKSVWDEGESSWQVYFHKDFFVFKEVVRKEAERLSLIQLGVSPTIDYDPIDYEKCSLAQLYDMDREYWRKLTEAVYKRSQDEEGYYHSAISTYKSKSRRYLQIDHIHPMSKGGLTTLDNLQVLNRVENAYKGQHTTNEWIKELPIQDLEDYIQMAEEDGMYYKSVEQHLREQNPENIAILLSEVREILKKQSQRGLMTRLDKILRQDKKHTEALRLKGNLCYQQGRYQEAVKYLEQVYNVYEEDVTYLAALGNCYAGLKQNDQALYFLHKGEKQDPEHIDILIGLGYIYDRKRKYNEALAYYTKAIQQDPANAVAWHNKGYTHYKFKQYDEALKHIEKAIILDSSEPSYQRNRMKVLKAM